MLSSLFCDLSHQIHQYDLAQDNLAYSHDSIGNLVHNDLRFPFEGVVALEWRFFFDLQHKNDII